jgi:hypothetical protein
MVTELPPEQEEFWEHVQRCPVCELIGDATGLNYSDCPTGGDLYRAMMAAGFPDLEADSG